MPVYSVRITAGTLDDLRSLATFALDLHERAARKIAADRFEVPGVLSVEDIARVEQAGYQVEQLDDLSRTGVERTQEVSRVNRFAELRGVEEFEQRSVLGYMTADEVESALINFVAMNSGIATLIELPHRTWNNRVCRAVRLRAGANPNRPGVLFTGSMHAREWGGSDICIAFLSNLAQAYRNNTQLVYGGKIFTSAQVRTILENLDIFVFPDVNPDGKQYSQTYNPNSGQSQSFWWRKNRNPNAAAGGVSPGVDLNRNFDFLWSSGIGTSAAASSGVYKGTAAFSEPETRNVRYLFDTFPSIGYFTDIHSFGRLLLYSWGDDDNQSTNSAQNFRNPVYDGSRGIPSDSAYREFVPTLDQNTMVSLAHRMNAALSAVRGTSYQVQQAVGLYPTSGTSDDYAFSRHIVNGLNRKIYAFTIEFGDEFVPAFQEMRQVINEVCAALTELCWSVNSDVFVRDNPADSGVMPSTGDFWNSPDVWVRNADDHVVSHQDTIRGRDNWLYVRVTNRGAAEAREVKVRVYIANFAASQFLFPNDWIPRNPSGSGSLGAPGTYLVGEVDVASLAAGATHIVRTRWPASLIPPATNWHPCILVEVSPNDGNLVVGGNVWHNNNLGQKNITIINARRGDMVEFPFFAGSKFVAAGLMELAVSRKGVPRNASVYLDVKDPAILAALKPVLAGYPTGAAVATLVSPATVAIPKPGMPARGVAVRDAEDSLVLHLPASTKVEFLAPTMSGALLPAGKIAATGFEIAEISGKSVLALTPLKQGRLRLPVKAGEMRPLSLKVAVPRNAAPGDKYQLQAVQYGKDGRATGGVVLEINVTA
ncbi:MAG: hypothetical protein JNL98_08545 [Bryobacterales bacterium]|nr:hypothetical protein [Bryobacterales bacterium]